MVWQPLWTEGFIYFRLFLDKHFKLLYLNLIVLNSRKGCPCVVMSESGRAEKTGWIPTQQSPSLRNKLSRLHGKHSIARVNSIVRSARHCEVVIAALKPANPQWTPLIDGAPEKNVSLDVETPSVGVTRHKLARQINLVQSVRSGACILCHKSADLQNRYLT